MKPVSVVIYRELRVISDHSILISGTGNTAIGEFQINILALKGLTQSSCSPLSVTVKDEWGGNDEVL